MITKPNFKNPWTPDQYRERIASVKRESIEMSRQFTEMERRRNEVVEELKHMAKKIGNHRLYLNMLEYNLQQTIDGWEVK